MRVSTHRNEDNLKIEMHLFILYNLQLEIINFLYKNLCKAACDKTGILFCCYHDQSPRCCLAICAQLIISILCFQLQTNPVKKIFKIMDSQFGNLLGVIKRG